MNESKRFDNSIFLVCPLFLGFRLTVRRVSTVSEHSIHVTRVLFVRAHARAHVLALHRHTRNIYLKIYPR